jgi:hypothetical protein
MSKGKFMRSFRLAITTLLLTATLGSQCAFAFEVDQTAGTNQDGSSRFSDPDDKIPFPHIADDGQPSNNFQAQPVGNSGISFGFTPSNSGSDAFQRAQDRMQQ